MARPTTFVLAQRGPSTPNPLGGFPRVNRNPAIPNELINGVMSL